MCGEGGGGLRVREYVLLLCLFVCLFVCFLFLFFFFFFFVVVVVIVYFRYILKRNQRLRFSV